MSACRHRAAFDPPSVRLRTIVFAGGHRQPNGLAHVPHNRRHGDGMRGACMRHAYINMGTDRDRLDAYLPLRPVEFHILLSLAGGARHGYGIIQDIEARDAAAVPDVGTMYRALARMVESGLIEAARSTHTVDGRRADYRITALGLRVAKVEAHRLNALTRAARLGGLLDKKAI